MQTARSQHRGMGSLFFVANAADSLLVEAWDEAGRSCHAIVPRALTTGATLAVTQRKNRLYIAPLAKNIDPTQLALCIYGNNNLVVKDLQDASAINIDTEQFRPGILNIALIDKVTQAVVAERLSFIYPRAMEGDSALCQISREGNRIDIALANDIPAGTYALSVTDEELSPTDSTSANIVASLLISQEIKGRIEDVNHYFRTSDERTRHDLDLLLLTQGWRRYALDKILSGQSNEITHKMESSQEIEGKISSTFQKHENYRLLALDPKSGFRTTLAINNSDRFIIPNIDYPEGALLQLQVETEKGNSKFLQLEVEPQTFPEIKTAGTLANDTIKAPVTEAIASKIRYRTATGTHLLPDFQVKAQKIKPMNSLNLMPDRYLTEEDPDLENANSMSFLVGKFGLYIGTITDTDTQTSVSESKFCIYKVSSKSGQLSFSGSNGIGPGKVPVDVILDGMLLEDDELSIATDLNPADIRQIEYFSNTNYSARQSFAYMHLATERSVSTGILVITTHKRHKYSAKNRPLSFATVRQLGYRQPVEFYVPRPETDGGDVKIEPLATLYWNPCVTKGSGVAANATFYTSDTAHRLTIKLEGIG
ncbi:MAG: hypothetical protein J6W69_07505, partial [Bacteroidales bacterium]|nr:hypothetical protein [Bacteroidales bacterium]